MSSRPAALTRDDIEALALLARTVDECCRRTPDALRPLLVPAIACILDQAWGADGLCIQGRICPRRRSYGHVCSCPARRLEKWVGQVGLLPAIEAERARYAQEAAA